MFSTKLPNNHSIIQSALQNIQWFTKRNPKKQRWTVGDVADALDMQCWRLGKVAKLLKKNRLVIKFSGSIQPKEFHASDLRNGQAWHVNNWSVIINVRE